MIRKKGNGTTNGRTLEIDVEAFRRLEEARRENESFSEVIKRCVKPRQSAEEILRGMRRAKLSDATLEAIDESATRRRRSAHRGKK